MRRGTLQTVGSPSPRSAGRGWSERSGGPGEGNSVFFPLSLTLSPVSGGEGTCLSITGGRS